VRKKEGIVREERKGPGLRWGAEGMEIAKEFRRKEIYTRGKK
jgi:hypothetical protein